MSYDPDKDILPIGTAIPGLADPVEQSGDGEADGENAVLEIPYELVLTGTAIALGVQLEAGQELILPWIRLEEAHRLNEQMLICIGEWEVSIVIDTDKAKAAKWRVFELLDGILDQRLRTLKSRPDSGLVVTVKRGEKEDKKGKKGG